MSERPVSVAAETLEFYRNFEKNPGWYCTLSSSELQARGLRPTHFCLEGFQARQGKTVHAGVLHVPDKDNANFMRQLSRVPNHNHECKTDVHPAFFDVDMSVSPHKKSFWQMVIAVIQDAGLNHEEIDCSMMQEYLKLPSLHPEMTTLPYGMVERLRLSKPFVLNATGDERWTWLDVARSALDPEAPNGVLGDAASANVVRPLACIFLMAIGKIIQKVCRSFYPTIADNDTKMQLFMLTNYTAETNVIHFGENPTNRETKIGGHAYVRQLIVDPDTQLYIWQALVDYFVENFGITPSPDGPQAFWQNVFDSAPYVSKVGGLRMPFSYKAAPCKRCNGSKVKRRGCDWCCGAGKLSSTRYYGPLCRIKPGGDVDTTEKGLTTLFNRVYLGYMATVRVACGTQATDGAVLEGRVVPCNLHMVQKGEIEARLGKSRAANTIRRLSDKTGIPGDSEGMQQVIATVNAEDAMHSFMSQKAPTISVRTPLVGDDTRFLALKKAFPSLISVLFHGCYGDVKVTGASLIAHSSNGEPKLINVFVKGAGASRCFNRMVDPSDAALSADVPRGAHRDVAGVPGNHTNWRNTAFFTIYRDDFGKIVQRCFNKQLKVNRRNSRAGSGKPCACCDWEGEVRMVGSQHSQFIRDFFYTQEQQREENCRREVVAQAKALARRHSKRQVDEIGPTEEYGAYVEKAIKKAKIKASISVEDLDPSDVGLRSASSGSSGAAFNFYL